MGWWEDGPREERIKKQDGEDISIADIMRAWITFPSFSNSSFLDCGVFFHVPFYSINNGGSIVLLTIHFTSNCRTNLSMPVK